MGEEPAPYDLIIRSGRVIDGTGSPWFAADVGIRGGRIAAIGALSRAAADRSIDARGLVVAPGFIDLMGQTAEPLLRDPRTAVNLLAQGITTILAGEGDSSAPLSGDDARRKGWRGLGEFLSLLEKRGLPLNVAQTVGHTQVRRVVLGETDAAAGPEELDRMRTLVREAMEAGAVGLSTALVYPPAIYASETEITELAKVTAGFGGRYFTHLRSEGDGLLEALDEALRVGREARIGVHVFHLKAAGPRNHDKAGRAIERIRVARASGQDVCADAYPYLHNGLDLRSFVHPRRSAAGPAELLEALADARARVEIRREMEEEDGWENWYAHAGSDWDNVILGRIADPALAAHRGASVAALARKVGEDPWQLFFRLSGSGAFAMPRTMSEPCVIEILRQDFVALSTDLGPAWGTADLTHPRGCGSFTRVLARYVRELGILSLEEAVRRMTSLAANEILAHDRGRLAPGLPADIAVFDAAAIRDRSTFEEPTLLSEGVRFVIVNGTVVFEEGRHTGALPGRVLRGPGGR